MKRGPLAIVLVVAATVGVLVGFSNLVQRAEWGLYDRFMRISADGRSSPGDVVIVAIDEPSYQQIGMPWPWPRSVHGLLAETLAAAGARRIVFDIVFDVPSEEFQDSLLAESLERTVASGVDVVLAGDLQYTRSGEFVQEQTIYPLALFRQAGAETGMATLYFDPDGVIRRAPARVGEYESLARAALEKPNATAADTAPGDRALGRSLHPLLCFYGAPRSGVRTVSYYQALAPDQFLPEGVFDGCTVFVGFSLGAGADLTTAADQYATPVGQRTAGAEIQATAFANARDEDFILDPFGATTGGGMLAAALALLAAVPIRRRSLLASVAGLALLYLAMVVSAFLLLSHAHIRIPIVQPAVAVFMVFLGVSGYRFTLGAIERRFILGAFKHYLAPAIVDEILDDPNQLSLGGSVRNVTILFSDIASFTQISERMTPESLTALLKSYFETMMDILLDHRATLDKFIGDAIMVFFGCPLDDPVHAAEAVGAARKMQQASVEMNRANQAQGLPALQTRIGINSGDVVAGNMGTSSVFNYTVIGDNVNLASRLEGANKAYGTSIIASGSTVAQLEEQSGLRMLDTVRVKGKADAVDIYEVMVDGVNSDSHAGTAKDTAAREHLTGRYESALSAYRSGDWKRAFAEFQALVHDYDDRPSAVMRDRCESYSSAPPPHWNGVHVMTEK